MPTVYAVLLAAGRGERYGSSGNKLFDRLDGRTLLERSVHAFLTHSEIARVIVAAADNERESVRAMAADRFPSDSERIRIVSGGATRFQSSLAGLEAAAAWEKETGSGSDRVQVLIHDAARCLVTAELISAVIDEIREYHCGAAPCVPVSDTIRVLDAPGGCMIAETLPRNRLAAMQTPQGADLDVMLSAARIASKKDTVVTDDVECLRSVGFPVRLIPGDPRNIKITRPEDLMCAALLLRQPRGGLSLSE